MPLDDSQRQLRWRLLLGQASEGALTCTLPDAQVRMDAAMQQLYDTDPDRQGGLGSSAPKVSRWLGDIRQYFPDRVVEVMQRDAVQRLGLTQLLLEPELLRSMQPNEHLVGMLLSLRHAMPEQTKHTARLVVAQVVEQIRARVATQTVSAVKGALQRSSRTHRPKLADVDWNATIRANLAHYLPDYRTVIPQRLVGYGRSARSFHKEVVVAIDQSGSMAASVVYASVFAAVLASMPSLKTSVVAFDTEVVDLTDQLADPVDVLFGIQLGGGTDINQAIAYSQSLITVPSQAVFVLISDLYEGGVEVEMLRRARAMRDAGVQVIALLALSDEGAPAYDTHNAAALVELGIPAFACTPDAFPDLLATALTGGDLLAWSHTYQATRAAGKR
jgi:Mg-chelatase subunit ChlD